MDRWLLGVTYAITVHDHEAAWFGWALNWLSYRPELSWYTPASSARIINGLVAHFINVDYTERPIEQLERIGILIQYLIVIVAAVWFSWTAKILQIKPISQLFIVIASCCIPTILIFAGHRGFYFEIGLLGVPLGLTLVAVLGGNGKAFRISGIACGFFVANYYPSIVTLLSFLFILGWARFRTVGWPGRELSTLSLKRSEWHLVLLVGICFVAWGAGAIGLDFPAEIAFEWMTIAIFLASGLMILFIYFMLIYIRWINGLLTFSIWFFITFISANLILLPWYPFGFFLARERSVAIEESLTRLLSSFVDHPWFYLLWLNLISLLIVFLYVKIRNSPDIKKRNQVCDIAAFSLLGILGIMLMGGAGLTSNSISGMAERSMIGVVPALSAGWFIIFRTIDGKWRPMYWGVLAALSMVVVHDFYRDYSAKILEVREDGRAVDKAIDMFLSANSDGRLVCVADEFGSRYCAAAYYFNRWRTADSAKRLPTRHLFGGRLVSLNAKMPDKLGYWDDSAKTVEHLLFPGPDYAYYVLANPDLKKAWQGSSEGLEEWGEWYWNSHGRSETRAVSPFHPNGPLLVITQGGFFRDQLIDLLLDRGMDFVPFYKSDELSRMDNSVRKAVPGDSFIMTIGDNVDL